MPNSGSRKNCAGSSLDPFRNRHNSKQSSQSNSASSSSFIDPSSIPQDDMKFDKQSIKDWISAYKQVELEIDDKVYYSTSPASAARAEETPESAEQTQPSAGKAPASAGKAPASAGKVSASKSKSRMLDGANKGILKIPPQSDFPLNLLEGFTGNTLENFHSGEKLNMVVEKLMLLQKWKGTNIQFVCKAGLLTQVGLTPHKCDDNSLKIVVEKLGNIYFMHMHTPNRVVYKSEFSDDENQYMGLKFEQLVTERADEVSEGGVTKV